MVVYLIPGLTGQGAVSPDTYAVVYPHWYSKLLRRGEAMSQEKVCRWRGSSCSSAIRNMLTNPMIVSLFEQQVGQQMVQQQVLLAEAAKLGIIANER